MGRNLNEFHCSIHTKKVVIMLVQTLTSNIIAQISCRQCIIADDGPDIVTALSVEPGSISLAT